MSLDSLILEWTKSEENGKSKYMMGKLLIERGNTKFVYASMTEVSLAPEQCRQLQLQRGEDLIGYSASQHTNVWKQASEPEGNRTWKRQRRCKWQQCFSGSGIRGRTNNSSKQAAPYAACTEYRVKIYGECAGEFSWFCIKHGTLRCWEAERCKADGRAIHRCLIPTC